MKLFNAAKRSARFALPSMLFVAGMSTGCATTDAVTGRSVNNMYSLEEEVQLGREFHKEILSEFKKEKTPINRDKVRFELLDQMVSNIAQYAHIKTIPYRMTYIGDPEIVNAFAFPGGQMMVFEGLWDEEEGLVQTVDELAAVVGHEIAHVNCRHSTEAMTRELVPNLLLAGGILWAELEEDEDMQLIFGGAMILYNGLIVTKYSREDELEADRIGMMYMAQAGYNPEAAPRIWARLAEAGESKLDKAFSIFSTHPRDKKRAEELRKHLPEAMALYEASPVKRDGTQRVADLREPGRKKKTAKTFEGAEIYLESSPD
jgi:predicted Zn-dependent protease